MFPTIGYVNVELPRGWELGVQPWWVYRIVEARLRRNGAVILQDQSGLDEGGQTSTSFSMPDLTCVNVEP